MHKRKSLNSGVSLLFMNLIYYDGQINSFFVCVLGHQKSNTMIEFH